MKRLKRIQIYWICQLIGWSLAALSDFVTNRLMENEPTPYTFLTFVTGVLMGIGITHIFRSIILEYRWLQKPFVRVLLYIFPSAFVMTLLSLGGFTIIGIINFILSPAEFQAMPIDEIPQNIVLIFYQSTIIYFLWYLIWSLIYFIYHAFENLQIAKIERVRLEGKYKEIELQQLRSQLNPHFLFNALNSVRALVDENPTRARESIGQLSNILRSALNVQRVKTITIDNEIAIVRDYLSLEKVRFEERLEYDLTISESAMQQQIPPMLVQTLVENAIKHGISQLRSGGCVKVTITYENENLEISIINTGQIINKNKYHGGFGIENTIERLKILYGEKANFTLKNYTNYEVEAKIIIIK